MRNPSATLLATLLTIAAALPMGAQTPTPNTTPGAVVRVVHLRIKPGRTDAFWADVRQNLKPVWDAEKQAGIISDYMVSTKSTTEGPNDWGCLVPARVPELGVARQSRIEDGSHHARALRVRRKAHRGRERATGELRNGCQFSHKATDRESLAVGHR